MTSPAWDVGDAGLQLATDAFWEQAVWWGTLGVILAFACLALLGLAAISRLVERRFWCPASHREVEVAFVERGLPGFLRAVAVRRCSAFEPPTDVRCQRACLDPGCRIGLPMARPLQGRNP